MPTVPRYDNFQVAPNNIGGARIESGLTPEMASVSTRQMEQVGQNMQRAASGFERIMLAEMEQANQVRVNDAMNKAVQAKLRLTYDPKEGYVNLRGDAALTRPDNKSLDAEYTERLQKELDAIAQGLGNEAQRTAFGQQAGRMSVEFQGGLNRHVAKEYTDYQMSVQDGTIATARDQMALEWGNPESVKQGQDAIKAAVYQKGKLAGWSAKQTEAAMVEALSPGHSAVVQGAVDAGKLDYAREYMKQVNAELTPQSRLQLAKVLEAGDFETKAQESTERFMAQANGDTAAALKLARENLSGKEEDAVVSRIKAIDAERVTLRERDQSDAADTAWRIYAETGGLGRIPASVMARMDGRDLNALRKTAKADYEASIAQREVKTDPNVYYTLTLAAANDPGFKNEDLRRYFDKLSPTDRKHFMDMQGKAQKPGEADNVATATQQITALANTIGLKDEQAGLFSMEANKALFAAQQAKGRPLDQAERQKVLDRLVIQGEARTGKWYANDPNMMLFEAQATGRAGQFVPEWTDDQKRKAEAALQRQGITKPTPQQVEAVLRANYNIQ